MAKRRREGKGVFGEAGLPVARRYLRPPSRRGLLIAGGLALAVLAVVALIDFLAAGSRLVSNGPLSSAHADLETSCSSCHGGFSAVSDAACSACHEPPGDELGVFTFAAHYVYRSDDFQRVVPSPDEEPCSSCHVEHEGRRAEITRVPDARCRDCHAYSPFHRRHPEIGLAATEPATGDGTAAVAATAAPASAAPASATPAVLAPSALAFPHIHHVDELMKRRRLDDVERACLVCHQPRPGGRSFQPIDFDRHCDACHLAATDRTPPLPVAGGGPGPDGTESVGVETLEAIRRRGGPGTRWADYANAGEFRRLGDRLVKTPLYHRDPWILYNLRRLRHELVGDGGLADLLVASPDVAPSELRTLYREAIATLERQARDLRSVPDRGLQGELAAIETALDELRRRLEDPHAPLDETAFLLSLPAPATAASAAGGAADEARAARIRTVAEALTAPCRRCHTVRDATIVRVQADLRSLRRAEFDHRAHVLQRRCLDCHSQIPIGRYLGSGEEVPAELDRAEIRNLPRVAVCAECHNRRLASERCVTCHLFHPEADRATDLALAVDREVPHAG